MFTWTCEDCNNNGNFCLQFHAKQQDMSLSSHMTSYRSKPGELSIFRRICDVDRALPPQWLERPPSHHRNSSGSLLETSFPGGGSLSFRLGLARGNAKAFP